MLGEPIGGGLEGGHHLGWSLTDTETPESVTRKIHFDEGVGTPRSQIQVGATLDDGELGLVVSGVGLLGSSCPVDGAIDGDFPVFGIGFERWTFVEDHGDVRPEIFLDLNGFFGCQFEQVSIDVRPKHGRLVGDLSQVGEAVDLEPATVGENRAIPLHELMEPAEFGDEVVSRPQCQVIGISKDDLHADSFELGSRDSFYGRLRTDSHEHGCVDNAVSCVHSAHAGLAVGVEDFELETHIC